MPKGPFLPSEFQPTSKFSTAQDKADFFGNAFLHFVDLNGHVLGIYEELLQPPFHVLLAHSALRCGGFLRKPGLISDADRLRFLRHTLAWPCWG